MALVELNDMLKTAIDKCDVKAFARVVDLARVHGATYNEIRSRVLAMFPDMTESDFETLMYDADTLSDDDAR